METIKTFLLENSSSILAITWILNVLLLVNLAMFLHETYKFNLKEYKEAKKANERFKR